jgi:hypothetical protein
MATLLGERPYSQEAHSITSQKTTFLLRRLSSFLLFYSVLFLCFLFFGVGGGGELFNDAFHVELHNLYSLSSIIRIIKSMCMWQEWGRRGTCIGYW